MYTNRVEKYGWEGPFRDPKTGKFPRKRFPSKLPGLSAPQWVLGFDCEREALCGLCALHHTRASISVYSFGAPRLGDGRMVRVYGRLEREGRLRIFRFANRNDTMTQRPSRWPSLSSSFHHVGRAICFTSKVTGMHGYWQYLQTWDSAVPVEEWVKIEQTRQRWSKKWIFILFIMSIYIAIVLSTLLSPGLQNWILQVSQLARRLAP